MRNLKKLIFPMLAIFLFFCVFTVAEEKKEVIKPPKKGFVTLSKQEYKKLLNKLKPAVEDKLKPPQNWVAKRADFSITVTEDMKAEGSVIYKVESLIEDKWIEAPLQYNRRGISINTPPEGLLVKNKGSGVYFGTNIRKTFTISGEINIDLQKKDLNKYTLRLYSSNAVINRFKIKWNPAVIKLVKSPAIETGSKIGKKTAEYSAIADKNRDLPFVFERVSAAKEAVDEKRRVEAATRASFSIEKGLIRASYHFKYTVNRGSFETFSFSLPVGLNIHSVSGADLYTWDEKEGNGINRLEIKVNAGERKKQDIYITGDLSYDREEGKITLPLVLPLRIARVKALIAVAASDEIEVATDSLENIQIIDISDLPSNFRSAGGMKPVLAYKFLLDREETPPKGSLTVREYERVAVLAANIENAKFLTLKTARGKSLTRALFWIRNNIKQNLKVTPPENFELWSCFADGNPVKPTLDPSGALLIPLKRSRDASSSILMKLELIFFSDDNRMGEEGMLHFRLPVVDLQIMKMGWELLLPLNYEYEDWMGNLRQTGRSEFLEYITPLSSGRAGQKKQQQNVSYQMNQFLQNDMRQQQVDQQANVLIQNFQKREVFGKVRAGRLPVKFSIPRAGRQFLFTRLLVVDKAPALSVEYELDD